MNAIASHNQQQSSESDFEWKAKIPHSVFVVTMVNSACAAAMHPCAKESTLASSSPDQGYLTYINRYHHPIQPLQLMALSAAAAVVTLERSWGNIGEIFPFFSIFHLRKNPQYSLHCPCHARCTLLLHTEKFLSTLYVLWSIEEKSKSDKDSLSSTPSGAQWRGKMFMRITVSTTLPTLRFSLFSFSGCVRVENSKFN